MRIILTLLACTLVLWTQVALATSNYEYGDDEYVTIMQGTSPDGKYALTTHGEGELGADDFYVYLTDAVTGRKIAALTAEVDGFLDTVAAKYAARWSADSRRVEITYLIGRHDPLQVISYRVTEGWAFRLTGPKKANRKQVAYWEKYCLREDGHYGKTRTFGTPKAGKPAGR